MSSSRYANTVLKMSGSRSVSGTGRDRVPAFKRNMVFQCQQAQGSSTALISKFANLNELYQKIADYYEFPIDEILFCTRNTRQLDMEKILTAELYHEDFLFVHRKGSKKEIKLEKSEHVLGLTLVDNGNGYTIVKQLKEGSIIDNCKSVAVGDHIERINNESMVGLSHKEVSSYLKSIPIGKEIVMHLVEPCKIEDGMLAVAIKSIEKLLKNDMGVSDAALAHRLFEMSLSKSNTMELAEAIDGCDLKQFGMSDYFIMEMWGIVTDAKAGRLVDREAD